MGSKGGSDQVQRSEPWAAQSPYLQDSFRQARQLYQSGGPQYFQGATYVPFSQQTEQGLGLMQQRALNGSPLTNAAQNYATNTLQQQPTFGGAQSYMQGAPSLQSMSQFAGVGQQPNLPGAMQQGLGGIGQGGFSLGQANQQAGVGQGISDPSGANQFANVGAGLNYAGAQGLAGVGNTPGLDAATQHFSQNLTGLPGATQNALTQTAQGQNLTGNPYLDKTFDIAAQRVTDKFNTEISPGLAAQFSLAGRTGSDALGDVQTKAAGEVSDSLGALANQIYGGNYQQERDRQLQAAGQLGSLSQAQQGLGLQAAGQGADLYNTGQAQDISRRGLAANIAGQEGQQDISRRSLAGSVYGQGQNADIARRQLGTSAFQQGQQQDIARRGLESSNLLQARGQDIQSGLGAGQLDISRLGMAGQLYNQGLAQQLQAAGIDAGVYGQNLSQQSQMAGLANSLANQDYANLDRLLGVGAAVEGKGQEALADQIARFNHYQNLPQQNLANYIAALQGNYGGTTTQQAPEPNRLMGGLGGAATGFAMGGPVGAIIGGIGGLLG